MTQLTGQFMQGGSMQLNATTGGILTGTIQLNAQAIAQLYAYTVSTGVYPYNTGTTVGATGQCISSIAVDAIYTSYSGGYGYVATATTGMINQAIVYVTLNSGQVVTLGFR